MRGKFVVAGAIIALVAVACGGSDDKETSSPTTSRPEPRTTAGASSQLRVGDPVTSKGTQLTAPATPDTRQIDAEQACRTFLETPAGQCDIVMMAGGNALWTLDALPGSGTDEQVWHLRIRTRSTTLPDGGWDVALALPDSPKPSFAHVAVRAADVTGDGRPELLVGYRSAGTGQFEAYDVVTYEQGQRLAVAAHRQQLHKGSVSLEGTTIVDYSADESSPECCPTTARRTAIAFSGGAFVVTEVGDVPIDQQPSDYFAS
jgi:hypothetical protein